MPQVMELKIDKSKWSDGPWMHEPDRMQWRHEGLDCLIVRNTVGALCGYVGVPPGHAIHEVDYAGVHEQFPDVSVHGGLTYADKCQGPICHVPEPGQSDDVWWLGFDAAHIGDLIPGRLGDDWPLFKDDVYRDLAYVTREVNQLAEQLANR